MPYPLQRRTVLKCLIAVAASTTLGCPSEEPPEVSRAHFPQSVASGIPRSTSVVLWTRAVDPDDPDRDVELTLEVARDEDFHHRVLKLEGLHATSAHDHILKVKVTNLEPRTRYFYRFVIRKHGEAWSSPVGRTLTAPSPEDAVPGWAFLGVGMFLLGGIQLIMMGVIGSCVGRIYIEVLQRPLYSLALDTARQARDDDGPQPSRSSTLGR